MTKKEYTQLRKTIDGHMDAYYNQDSPVISDYEYDQLMLQLKEAEREHPEWVDADSPTQKIGGTAKREAGVKVTHLVPMLSIEDVFTKEEVSDWIGKVKALHPDAAFSVEYKIDGLSMTLRYEADPAHPGQMNLELAETRGDGLIGEDVTANARVIPDVKQTISIDCEYLELRGEVYMTHEDFERFNREQEQAGKKTAANPRNLAAGTLRQLDSSVTRERMLRMFIFNVQQARGGTEEKIMTSSQCEALDRLSAQGIPVVFHTRCLTAGEVSTAIDSIGEVRQKLQFDLDGAVVKIDQIAYRPDFPAGSKYSAGHIAYKYPPEERNVVMDEIEVAVGRTDKLSFTGLFHDEETGKPARLCGTSVSRATLHNQDYIRDMKVGVGGVYRLYKSGEIIPRLNGCVKEPEKIFEAPKLCPVCGHPLVREEDTADIRCINPSCPAQISRTIAYFASRDAMNIVGLGQQLVDGLVREGYLSSYAGIYHLREYREELIEKGLIGKEKNTDKLLAQIELSKENDPVRLLTGLAIRNVGKSTAREVMKHVEDLRDLESYTIEQYMEIPDIGATTAGDLYTFFHDPDSLRLLQDMVDMGVRTKVIGQEGTTTKLEGLTIVVTGTLPTLGRKDAEALIAQNGGKPSGSVSKRTSYVLAGEGAGSKLTKAQQLGIPVIDEQTFLAMIGKEGA